MNLNRSSRVKYILLVPERKFLKKCKVIIPVRFLLQQRRDYSEISRSQSTDATVCKHNKFLPNILKNTRSTERTLNDSILSDLDKQKATNGNQAYENYKNRGVTKRRRKQVLSCLQSNEGNSLKFEDSWENNDFERFVSLPEIENYSVPDKITIINENTSEGKPSKISDKKESNCFICNDLYAADLKSSCPTSDQRCAEPTTTDYTSDESIEIVNKSNISETSDYENYIPSEDPYFNVGKRDKLLSSNIYELAMDSLSSYGGTEIVEYDLNGNNIANQEQCANQIYDTEMNWDSVKYQIDQYYNDGVQEPSNTSLEQGQDSTFENMMSLWANDLETCCLTIDNFDFDLNFDKLSSTTETASECDATEEMPLSNFGHSSPSSPKENDSNNSACPLAISQVVPDNVFSDEFDESRKEGKEDTDDGLKLPLQSIPMLPECQPNTDNFIDDINCTSTPLFATYDLLEYGNCLLDEKLNFGYSNSDVEAACRCFTTSLDDHIEFERQNLSNLDDIIPNLDLENVDDIEVSKRLKLYNTNVNPTQIIPTSLQKTCVLDRSSKKSKPNKPSLLNASDLLKPNHHEPSFFTIKSEDGSQAKMNPLSRQTHNATGAHRTKSNRKSSKLQSILIKNLGYAKSFIPKSRCEQRSSRPNDERSACSSSISRAGKTDVVLADDVQLGTSTKDVKVVTSKTVMPVDKSSENPIKRVPVQIEERKVLRRRTVVKSNAGKSKYINEVDLDLQHGQNPHCPQTYSLQLPPEKCLLPDRLILSTNLRKHDPGLRKRTESMRNNNKQNVAGHRGEKKHNKRSNLQSDKTLQFSQRGSKLVCDKCSKEYCSLGFIKKHLKQHDNYSLTCRFCGSHFANKTELKHHFHHRHLRTEYRCNFCGNRFYARHSYLQHYEQYHDQSGGFPESII